MKLQFCHSSRSPFHLHVNNAATFLCDPTRTTEASVEDLQLTFVEVLLHRQHKAKYKFVFVYCELWQQEIHVIESNYKDSQGFAGAK